MRGPEAIEHLLRHLPRSLRSFLCEFVGHDTYRAPSGLFTYCLRCHTTLTGPTANPPNPHLPRDRRYRRSPRG